jgi:hypothetical protein
MTGNAILDRIIIAGFQSGAIYHIEQAVGVRTSCLPKGILLKKIEEILLTQSKNMHTHRFCSKLCWI